MLNTFEGGVPKLPPNEAREKAKSILKKIRGYVDPDLTDAERIKQGKRNFVTTIVEDPRTIELATDYEETRLVNKTPEQIEKLKSEGLVSPSPETIIAHTGSLSDEDKKQVADALNNYAEIIDQENKGNV